MYPLKLSKITWNDRKQFSVDQDDIETIKVWFFKNKNVKYLGHLLSQDGVETDPDQTQELTTCCVPQDVKQLRSFLGFAGYYRRYIKIMPVSWNLGMIF